MGSFLSAASRSALERLIALDEDPNPAPLERLGTLRSVAREVDAEPANLASVRAALAAGAGWDAIASAAGLKAAAAKWRWQGTDAEITARQDAGRKRAARPSSVPTDLPGYSVADAARRLGVTPQAIYLQVSRGKLASQTVELEDGRSYKRVFLNGQDTEDSARPDEEPA
jgi:hypothetical protein